MPDDRVPVVVRLPSRYFVLGDPFTPLDGWIRPLYWRRGESVTCVGAITDPEAAEELIKILNADTATPRDPRR